MKDLISIIIPVYNVSNYLDKCLESICNQTYQNIEIITVNDGSKDDSLNILKKWKKKDSRITIIDKENGGLSSARNAGIEKATGKYIMFIDSDDFADKKFIEILYTNLKKYNKKISICNRYYYYEDGKKYLRFKDNNSIINMDLEEAFLNLLNFINFDMSAWAKLYARELFNDIRFPEKKLSEDYYIMYKLFDKTDGVVYTSKPLLYYLQQRKGSITRNNKIIYDYIIASKKQMEFICNKYEKLSLYAKSAYCLSYFTVYNKLILNGGKADKKFIKEMKRCVKKYYTFVKNNKYINKSRKIQIIIFKYLNIIYNPILKIYMKKVKS